MKKMLLTLVLCYTLANSVDTSNVAILNDATMNALRDASIKW